jgi:hypothetical protein
LLPSEPGGVKLRIRVEFSTQHQSRTTEYGKQRTATDQPAPIDGCGGAVINSFQDVKDQLSSSGFSFRNPGKPKAVEWASARSKSQLVQSKASQKQDQRDDGDVGFM